MDYKFYEILCIKIFVIFIFQISYGFVFLWFIVEELQFVDMAI